MSIQELKSKTDSKPLKYGCLLRGAQILILFFSILLLGMAISELHDLYIFSQSSQTVIGKITQKEVEKNPKVATALRYTLEVEYFYQNNKYRVKRHVQKSYFDNALINHSIEIHVAQKNPEIARFSHGESTGLFWYILQIIIALTVLTVSLLLNKLIRFFINRQNIVHKN